MVNVRKEYIALSAIQETLEQFKKEGYRKGTWELPTDGNGVFIKAWREKK